MDAAIREMEQLSQRSQAAAQMAVQEAAKLLEFEYAAQIRDKIKELTGGK